MARLLDIEALPLGIEGKRLGALTLERMPDQGVQAVGEELAVRAADQRSRLEAFRVGAADRVIAAS